MVNPEYAVNFVSIATQVTATLLGFGIFSYFFWYENVGVKIKIEITQKLKGFRVFRRNGKFHKKIIMNKNPLFVKFKKFTKIFGTHIIYNFLEGKWIKYHYKKANSDFYYRAFVVILFFMIILFGAGIVTYNISFLNTTSQFSNEQLAVNMPFKNGLNTVQEYFQAFIGGFIMVLLIIVIETIGFEYKEKKQYTRCFGKCQNGNRCKRIVKLPEKYCYQHKQNRGR